MNFRKYKAVQRTSITFEAFYEKIGARLSPVAGLERNPPGFKSRYCRSDSAPELATATAFSSKNPPFPITKSGGL